MPIKLKDLSKMKRDLNDFIPDVTVLSVEEFRRRYNITKTNPAIGYDMRQGKVDWCQSDRDRFLILTEKTRNYYNI